MRHGSTRRQCSVTALLWRHKKKYNLLSSYCIWYIRCAMFLSHTTKHKRRDISSCVDFTQFQIQTVRAIKTQRHGTCNWNCIWIHAENSSIVFCCGNTESLCGQHIKINEELKKINVEEKKQKIPRVFPIIFLSLSLSIVVRMHTSFGVNAAICLINEKSLK